MPNRLIDDPEYVQGQIAAVQSLVLAIANLVLEREEFRDEALTRLEVLRTALLGSAAGDARLLALDHIEEWLRNMTAPSRRE